MARFGLTNPLGDPQEAFIDCATSQNPTSTGLFPKLTLSQKIKKPESKNLSVVRHKYGTKIDKAMWQKLLCPCTDLTASLCMKIFQDGKFTVAEPWLWHAGSRTSHDRFLCLA